MRCQRQQGEHGHGQHCLPDDDDPAAADALGEARRDEVRGGDEGGHRHEHQARRDARHAAQLLVVEAEEERHAVEPGVDREPDREGHRHLPLPQQPRRNHGRAVPLLGGVEGVRGAHGHGGRGEDGRVRPAQVPALDDGEREPGEGQYGTHLPREVERRRAAGRAGGAGQERQDHRADRQVEEEDGAPSGGLREDAAEHRSDRDGRRAAHRPQRDGPGPAARIVVRLADQGERGGHHDGGGPALRDAGGDQRADAGREGTGQRGGGEQPHTPGVRPPRPGPVGERPRRRASARRT